MSQHDLESFPPADPHFSYTQEAVSWRTPAPPRLAMPQHTTANPLESHRDELIALVHDATYWRLRLRNTDPRNNQNLEANDPDFLPPDTESWAAAEAKFYDRLTAITAVLGTHFPDGVLNTPLETLMPLAALLKLFLNHQHPASSDSRLPASSPYYASDRTQAWNKLDFIWHKLRDHIGRQLHPTLVSLARAPWIKAKAEEQYQVTLQGEHLDDVNSKIWQYLSLSLAGQDTVKGRDCMFNPHYGQAHGQKATVKAWVSKRLWGCVQTVAQREGRNQYGTLRSQRVQIDPDTGETIDPLAQVPDRRPAQPWWEVIQARVAEYREELQNIKPRNKSNHHINAEMVILNRLPPPQDWKILAQRWGCDRTTLERFYQNKCVPWLRDYCEELIDWL